MTEEDKQLILGALDSLAILLSEYNHVWKDGERAIYEQACELIKSEEDENYEEDDERQSEWPW